jgi:hypothetical protein
MKGPPVRAAAPPYASQKGPAMVMDDPAGNEGKPTEPAPESFDQWWPKHLDEVDASVTAAEQYLEVPPGTISSIQRDADYVATVKTYAVIEPMLNEHIAARGPRGTFVSLASLMRAPEPDENFQAFVARLNMSGRSGKIALAKSLGLLRQDQVHFIEGVARIRNRYAHNVRNMHRSLAEILTEEQQGNAKIVEHVTGLVMKLPSLLGRSYLKLFMYHRLSDYLSDALHTLRPPPLPAGGVLSGLFGILNASEGDADVGEPRA